MRALAVLALAGACAGEAAEDGTLEVGTGVRQMTPLGDGDPIDVYTGPQGGTHIYVSLWMSGLDPTEPRVRYRVSRAAGELADEELSASFTEAGERWELVGVGVRFYLDGQQLADPAEVAGDLLELAVTVTDGSGARAEGSARATARVASP